MPTLRDIADRLNLSPATVSRCLNSHPDMSQETRAAVLKVAAELGYVRRKDRAGAVEIDEQAEPVAQFTVVLRHRPHNDWNRFAVAGRLLAGITAQAEELGVRVQLRHATPDDPDEPMDPRPFVDPASAGYLFVGRYDGQAMGDLAANNPAVLVMHYDEAAHADCIDQDNAQGVALLMRHLHDHGHRRIAFVSDGTRRVSYRERFAGYLAEAAQEGMPDLNLAINCAGEALPRPQVADRLAELVREGVTAAVCVNDALAYDLMGRLRDGHGLKAPQDLSLVGFDALPCPEGLPLLTSVETPFEEMGASAIRRLVQRTRVRGARPIRVMFSCQLRPGVSVRRV